MKKVVTVFGTRPEAIKLAPVLWALERRPQHWRSVSVCSSQHTDLLRPMIHQLRIRVDHDLGVMTPSQQPADVAARVISGLSNVLAVEQPDVVLVQGDTTTALAGALAGFYARVPVGHVEAGLRTGDRHSPFPEEVNRRLITQLADYHFAATPRNVETLVSEGVAADRITLTGNTVVDALQRIVHDTRPSSPLAARLAALRDRRILALTTHRRENFGAVMAGYLRAIRRFADRHPEVCVVFPVHPNPAVRAAVNAELGGASGIQCVEPLDYADFLHLLSSAWLVASDSGGVQEEAPSLGVPVLILRETTERPEVLECGIGRLVGGSAERLEGMLEEALYDAGWRHAARSAGNPFGSGDAGSRIARALERHLGCNEPVPAECSLA